MVLENTARLMGVILLGDTPLGTHPYTCQLPGRLMHKDGRSLACSSGGPDLNSALSAAFCLASAFFSWGWGAGNCLLIKQDILDFFVACEHDLSLSLPLPFHLTILPPALVPALYIHAAPHQTTDNQSHKDPDGLEF